MLLNPQLVYFQMGSKEGGQYLDTEPIHLFIQLLSQENAHILVE